MNPYPVKLMTTLFSVTFLLLSCSSGDNEALNDPNPMDNHTLLTQALTSEPLANDQTFTYWQPDEHSSLDPQRVSEYFGEAHVRNLFEGLLNQDENGRPAPGVAERFELSQDKLTYTFFLRPEATWSNGDPLTAHDFVYAWQRAVNPKTKSPYAWYLNLMSIKQGRQIIDGEADIETLGVTAVDDQTLTVELIQPLTHFPTLVTHPVTFPVHKATLEQHGSKWTDPEHIVSNGAYQLVSHKKNEQVILQRNPNYWNDAETTITTVTAIINPDQTQLINQWESGEIDWIDSIPSGKFKSLSESFPSEMLAYPKLCNYYYAFNLSPSGPLALKDVRVRKALSYALDRRAIIEQILQAGQQEAYTFTPTATAGFISPRTEIETLSQYERDTLAKTLLEEAGYSATNPLTFNLLYNTSDAHKQIALAMSQLWREKLPVDAKLVDLEWETFLDRRAQQDFDIARGGWCGDYNESSAFLQLVDTASLYNDGNYSNPVVDRELDEASSMWDPSQQYSRIEQQLADDMPLIPIYHYSGQMLLKSTIKQWPLSNAAHYWYARELYKTAE